MAVTIKYKNEKDMNVFYDFLSPWKIEEKSKYVKLTSIPLRSSDAFRNIY